MCQKTCDLKPSHSVANLFAPCKKFFENVFNLVGELELTYKIQNIIIGGDFIMNFKQSEVKNRNYSAQESRIVQIAVDFCKVAGLIDA